MLLKTQIINAKLPNGQFVNLRNLHEKEIPWKFKPGCFEHCT